MSLTLCQFGVRGEDSLVVLGVGFRLMFPTVPGRRQGVQWRSGRGVVGAVVCMCLAALSALSHEESGGMWWFGMLSAMRMKSRISGESAAGTFSAEGVGLGHG